MKALALIAAIICISACSNKISPYFKNNKYIAVSNNIIINDSLKFQHKSYGDVDFTKEKKHLKLVLKQKHYRFDNVLAYGKTNIEPIYEYFILIDSKTRWKEQPCFYIKDTVANNHTYTFIGIPQNNHLPEYDFKYLSSSFKFEEDYNKGTESIMAVSEKYANTNLFYKALTEISDFPVYDSTEENIKLQLQLTYASFLGPNNIYNSLIKEWEKGMPNDSISAIIKAKGISGLDNVKTNILTATKDRKVVMFNENHFYPEHRRFFTMLLPKLKEQGFKYLALEALYEKQDSVLNLGNKVSLQSGFYTKEQNYRQLIETAQELGFLFVVYEYSSNGNREEMQATNLYNKTIGLDKSAKVVVFAGIDHINKLPGSDGKKRMAAYFKEKYNIDSLTFSQTGLLLYRYDCPDVTLLESSDFSNNKLHVTDYQIVNNISLKDSLHNFEYKNNFKQTVQLNIFEFEENKKSYMSTVPYKSRLVESNEIMKLHLTKGSKKIIILNKEGNVIEEQMISL
ncbi:hypothetical protein [Flavobacterium sp. Sd200]|uniref:hypothetical protein n=1 Tax=Flavobacterium sp. Sd200 TaxID=2692211 RepID=UPI001F4090B0|nr:hypothetical protein [Flavobacterium sp. Sd200]